MMLAATRIGSRRGRFVVSFRSLHSSGSVSEAGPDTTSCRSRAARRRRSSARKPPRAPRLGRRTSPGREPRRQRRAIAGLRTDTCAPQDSFGYPWRAPRGATPRRAGVAAENQGSSSSMAPFAVKAPASLGASAKAVSSSRCRRVMSPRSRRPKARDWTCLPRLQNTAKWACASNGSAAAASWASARPRLKACCRSAPASRSAWQQRGQREPPLLSRGRPCLAPLLPSRSARRCGAATCLEARSRARRSCGSIRRASPLSPCSAISASRSSRAPFAFCAISETSPACNRELEHRLGTGAQRRRSLDGKKRPPYWSSPGFSRRRRPARRGVAPRGAQPEGTRPNPEARGGICAEALRSRGADDEAPALERSEASQPRRQRAVCAHLTAEHGATLPFVFTRFRDAARRME